MCTSVRQGGGRGGITSPEPERIQESEAQQKRQRQWREWAASGSLRPSLLHACSSESELAVFLGLPTEPSIHPIGRAQPRRRRHDSGSGNPGSQRSEGVASSSPPSTVSPPLLDLDQDLVPADLQDAGQPVDERGPADRRPGGRLSDAVVTALPLPPRGQQTTVSPSLPPSLPLRGQRPDAVLSSSPPPPPLQFVSHWGRRYGSPITDSLIRPGTRRSLPEGAEGDGGDGRGGDGGGEVALVLPDGSIPAMPPWRR